MRECSVCHVSSSSSLSSWSSAAIPLPFSRSQLLFKLNFLTQAELQPMDVVCPDCVQIIIQVDELQHRLNALIWHCETSNNSKSEKSPSNVFKKGRSFKSEQDEDVAMEEEDDITWDNGMDKDQLDRGQDEEEYVEGGKKCGGKKRLAIEASVNLDDDNLDCDLAITRTNRNQEKLIYRGFTYIKRTASHQPKYTQTLRWLCPFRYKTQCKGKLSTTSDSQCVLKDSVVDHNHKAEQEQQVRLIMFRNRVKEIIINHPDMKPLEIRKSVQLLLDDTPESFGFGEKTFNRFIQRVKKAAVMQRKLEEERQADQSETETSQSEHLGRGQVGTSVSNQSHFGGNEAHSALLPDIEVSRSDPSHTWTPMHEVGQSREAS